MSNSTRVGRASPVNTSSRAGEAALKAAIDAVGKRNSAGKLGSLSVRFVLADKPSKELKPKEAMEAFLSGKAVDAVAVQFRKFTSGGKLTPTTRTIRVKVANADVRTFNTTGRGKEGPESMAKWVTQQLEKPTKETGTGRSRHPGKLT